MSGTNDGMIGCRYPGIADARTLATRFRCAGVLILFVRDGQVGFASYGHRRETCNAMGKVGNEIQDQIEDGRLFIPECLRGE